MRKWMCAPALLLALCVQSFGQHPRTDGPEQARLLPSASVPVEGAHAHAPLPVTIWFKDGRRVGARLIRSGPDSLLVEMGGKEVSIPAAEVEGALLQARLFDSFGSLASNDMKARLDNFAIELQNSPGARGFGFCYGGRRPRPGEAQAYCDRMRSYLVNARGLDPSRVVLQDGGFRENLAVELWIVPYNTVPPAASPTLSPSEVRPVTPKKINKKGKGKKGTAKGRRRG